MPMLEHKKRFMNLIQLQLDFNKVYWEIQYNNSKKKVTRLPDLLFFVTYTDFLLSCSHWVPGSFSISCTLTLGMTMLAGGIKWLAMRFLCIIRSWCPEATLRHLVSRPWKLFGKGQALWKNTGQVIERTICLPASITGYSNHQSQMVNYWRKPVGRRVKLSFPSRKPSSKRHTL